MSRSRTPLLVALLAVLGLLLGGVPAYAAENRPPAGFVIGKPYEHGHAHNDYAHEHPLFDAMGHSFTSIEADVWYAGDQLNVGHDPFEAAAGRTLDDLYLAPLARLVRAQGGRAYPCWPGELQLLVDFKSLGEQSYAELERELARYPDVFSHVVDGKVVKRAVRVVISGERPLETMQADTERWAFYDGRTSDLADGAPRLAPSLMPLVSQSWGAEFSWNGEGEMPAEQKAKLDDLVRRAHAGGYELRFWGTPDSAGPARDRLWRTLYAAGVDHLNTDDLAGMETFLGQREKPHPGCVQASPTPSRTPSATPSASATPTVKPSAAPSRTPEAPEREGGLAKTGQR